MKLAIITPFKNESKTLEPFIKSILKQNYRDFRWLLVNDGSDDDGEVLAKSLLSGYDNITVVNRESKVGVRKTGGNVVDVINEGISMFKDLEYDWDILLKIDADTELIEDNHFDFICGKFRDNDDLGIASGNVFHYSSQGQKIYESKYRWKTQGQAKFYRKECFEAIGGLKPFKGWDGIDDAFARSKGYITQKFYELDVLHKYETQTRTDEGGIFAGVKREVSGYRNRAYPLYFYIVKALKLMPKKPFILRATYFLLYSFYANIFISHKLNKEEVKMIRRHIRNQIIDQFDYID